MRRAYPVGHHKEEDTASCCSRRAFERAVPYPTTPWPTRRRCRRGSMPIGSRSPHGAATRQRGVSAARPQRERRHGGRCRAVRMGEAPQRERPDPMMPEPAQTRERLSGFPMGTRRLRSPSAPTTGPKARMRRPARSLLPSVSVHGCEGRAKPPGPTAAHRCYSSRQLAASRLRTREPNNIRALPCNSFGAQHHSHPASRHVQYPLPTSKQKVTTTSPADATINS